MPRGETAEVGTRRQSKNGYWYVRTEDKWELVHRIIAEANLGRKLTQNEYATFSDNDRENLDPKNIIVRIRGRASLRKRLAEVEARIQELSAIRDQLRQKLNARTDES